MSEDERITRGMRSQLGDRRRALAGDDRALGWKLGFGTEAAMKKLGIDGPLVGYLLESARLESGAVVDISTWGNPRLEPEIVARVGEDGGIAAIGALPGVLSAVRADGDGDGTDVDRVAVKVALADDSALTHVVTAVAARGANLIGLAKSEPSLEDVFVELVGRGFGDEGNDGAARS